MKKLINLLLGMTVSVFASVCLTACGNGSENVNKEHIHTFSDTYTMTETEHYKKATCAHADKESAREVHKYGSADNAEICTVCGYDRTAPPASVMYTINDIASDEYTVVYGAGNTAAKAVAEKLAYRLSSYVGVDMDCVSDAVSDTGNEIIVGVTNRKRLIPTERGKYTVSTLGDSILLASENTSGLIAAARKVADDIYDGSVDYTVTVDGVYDDLTIKAMSYNIRYTDENRWHRIKDVIVRNDPDILGTQECSGNWQNKLKTDLPGYGWIGEGRDGANTEACFILYKESKYTLEESGTQWYSETPAAVSSKYPESTMSRIFTYAKFVRKLDGMEFAFINTHLDLNQTARLKAVRQLVEFTENEFGDLPVYITGDFNTDVNNVVSGGNWLDLPLDEYDVDDYLSDKGYDNTRLTSTVSSNDATFPTTMYPDDKVIYTDRIIDYCFVSGKIFADKYYVDRALPDNPGSISGLGPDASDHYPVILESTLYRKL